MAGVPAGGSRRHDDRDHDGVAVELDQLVKLDLVELGRGL